MNFLKRLAEIFSQKVQWAAAPAVLFIGIGLLCVEGAEAVVMTKEEYQMLPPYCRNQNHVAPYFYQPEKESYWRSRLGKDYEHIHHYCWALVNMTRSYRAGNTRAVRRFLMYEASQDIMFSLQWSSPDFALLPEMYTKIGEAYLGFDEEKKAENAFQKAWEANPSYWPPYVWWSQYLLKQGKVREALSVAEDGKKNAPDSKSLDKLIEDIKKTGKASIK